MLRFSALDGWRGIAAAFVALYHLNFLNHIHDWDFLRNSYLFVDFFFVLSGFVITHAYKDRLKNISNFTHFISRRLSRLLPLHLFLLLLFVLLEIGKWVLYQFGVWNADAAPFTNEYSVISLLSNVFLAHSLGFHDYLSWNYPSWSISVEFYTYIVFALVGLITCKSIYFRRLVYFILIAVSFYYIFNNTQNLNDATYHYGIFRCIAGFFLGSICYRVFLKTKDLNLPIATFLEIGSITLIYLFVSYLGKDKLSLFAPIIFTLTVYIFSFEQGYISKLLKANPIQNLGKWSYSIYMVHAFIILLIGRIINVFEKIYGQTYSVTHLHNDTTTELIFFKNIYIMDALSVIFIMILIYISSLTYKYIEMRKLI